MVRAILEISPSIRFNPIDDESRRSIDILLLARLPQYRGEALDNDPVVITHSKGRIQYVSPFFKKNSGYGLDEVQNTFPAIVESYQLAYSALENRVPG